MASSHTRTNRTAHVRAGIVAGGGLGSPRTVRVWNVTFFQVISLSTGVATSSSTEVLARMRTPDFVWRPAASSSTARCSW